MTRTFRIEPATELGLGRGANASGRRERVTGFYVVDNTNRRVFAVKASSFKPEAIEWARNKAQSHADMLGAQHW